MVIVRILAAALALLAGCAAEHRGLDGAGPDEARLVAAIVDPLIEAERARSGMPGAALVFVRGGRIVYQRGYGVADLARRTPVDPERTVWPIASITKVLTAIAALQLAEEGKLSLDGDVNRALTRLQVPDQGFGPLTLRQLLTHTAALDELPGRRSAAPASPNMAAFLRGRLRRYRAPGAATAYGSYGMMLAGVLVEEASGLSYAEFLRRRIFDPADMRSARVMAEPGDEAGVATPYLLEDGNGRPIPHEWYASLATSSAVASASDMGRLIAALLDEDRPAQRRLLSPATFRAMTGRQATIHPDVPGWGFGFQLDEVNGRAVAEHGGDIGGFAALLVLIPQEDAGFFIVSHGEGSDLRFRVRQALLDRLWPAPAEQVPPPDPAAAPRLQEYAGRYLSSMVCRTCPGDAAEVFELAVEGDGTLRFWGQRWIPLARDLFIRDDGRRRLGFSRDAAGRIASVSGGSWRVADRLPPA